MPIPYKIIEIFTSEAARHQGKPLTSAIVEYVSGLRIAARCMVTRGTEGSYEGGEIAAGRLEVLSYNMPVLVTIILPESDFSRVLSALEEMVTDGIVAARDMDVLSHRTRGHLIPAHTRVRDIMTADPRKAGPQTPLSEVARLLLSSTFTGLPIVDEENRPLGVITQGDLIYKAGLPMRLGLLAASEPKKVEIILEALAFRQAREIMTQPALTAREDQLVTEAVGHMIEKNVKRLPIVNETGRLMGILSRVDVFRGVMKACPNWSAFREKNIQVDGLRSVSNIMRRDTHTVLPDAPVEEVMHIIHCSDIQRVCVVDKDDRFIGLISDRDLLVSLSQYHPGIWDYFASKIPFIERGRRNKELLEHLRARTAAEVMKTDIVTVREDTPVEEAIRLMLERSIKRLPVLDPEGRFKGMISRDALLRTGFGSS